MTEDPTQRIRPRRSNRPGHAADAPTTALPGPLNLAGAADADSSTTDVLSLDELFEGQPPAETGPDAGAERAPSAAAPTWTAMPVVAVRSEAIATTQSDPVPGPASGPAPASPQPAIGGRMRSDAAAAWEDTRRRTRAWLARDDNALMLLTALVAVLLILAVTAFGR
jgi:hypothetical protein